MLLFLLDQQIRIYDVEIVVCVPDLAACLRLSIVIAQTGHMYLP